MGQQLFIVGTHALFAYEALSGVLFLSDILATEDIDLLFDARRRLKLKTSGIRREGLLGILRSVDKSFQPVSNDGYRAANKDGFLVDLIAPEARDPTMTAAQRLGEDGDLVAAEIRSLMWLQNVPSVFATPLDERGYPVLLAAPHPLAFAAYKRWMAQQPSRHPLKRRRDAEQGEAVLALLPRLAASVPEFKAEQLPGPLRAFGLVEEDGEQEQQGIEPNW
jgi:hypothetical protein